MAGHDTTADMFPFAVVALLRHPGQLAALRAGLWPGAVEEPPRPSPASASARARA
ncbi:hypothetical protein [Streptomyces sp. NPDC002324]